MLQLYLFWIRSCCQSNLWNNNWSSALMTRMHVCLRLNACNSACLCIQMFIFVLHLHAHTPRNTQRVRGQLANGSSMWHRNGNWNIPGYVYLEFRMKEGQHCWTPPKLFCSDLFGHLLRSDYAKKRHADKHQYR